MKNGVLFEKIKKISIALALVMTIGIVVAFCVACEGYISFADGIEYKKNADRTGYVVTSIGDFNGSTVRIKSIYRGMDVVEIGDGAFKNCTFIKLVELPQALQKIGDSAFEGCTGVEEFLLPTASLRTIGKRAFANCAFAKISIPALVTNIGEEAFAGCANLTEISLPGNVKQLSANTFKGCVSLKRASLSTGLESIGDGAFEGCIALETALPPQTLKHVGNNAFKGCQKLYFFTWNSGLLTIGDFAFEGVSQYWSGKTLTLPWTVTYVGNGAFKDTQLAQIVICSSSATWHTTWNVNGYAVQNGASGN